MFFLTFLFISTFSCFLHGSQPLSKGFILVSPKAQKRLGINWQYVEADFKIDEKIEQTWGSSAWKTLQHPVLGAVVGAAASAVVTKGLQVAIDYFLVDQQAIELQKESVKQQLEAGKNQLIANEFVLRNAEQDNIERCKQSMFHGSSAQEREAAANEYLLLLALRRQRLEEQLKNKNN